MSRAPLAGLLFAAALSLGALAAETRADTIDLGAAAEYSVLFQDAARDMADSAVQGNVGLGTNRGRPLRSGAGVSGRIDVAAPGDSAIPKSDSSTGINFNVGAVTSALDSASSLSKSLMSVADARSISLRNTRTVDAAAGTLANVNGQDIRVFDVTNFKSRAGSTLTIHGSASDLVAFNLDGLGKIRMRGGIAFTGGIGAENVVFNVGGGNYRTFSGGHKLEISNRNGAAGIAQGIFLNPNGRVSAVEAQIFGRVFGGDMSNFRQVALASADGSSLSSVFSTSAVPVPPAVWSGAVMLALLGAVHVIRRRRSVVLE